MTFVTIQPAEYLTLSVYGWTVCMIWAQRPVTLLLPGCMTVDSCHQLTSSTTYLYYNPFLSSIYHIVYSSEIQKGSGFFFLMLHFFSGVVYFQPYYSLFLQCCLRYIIIELCLYCQFCSAYRFIYHFPYARTPDSCADEQIVYVAVCIIRTRDSYIYYPDISKHIPRYDIVLSINPVMYVVIYYYYSE